MKELKESEKGNRRRFKSNTSDKITALYIAFNVGTCFGDITDNETEHYHSKKLTRINKMLLIFHWDKGNKQQ